MKSTLLCPLLALLVAACGRPAPSEAAPSPTTSAAPSPPPKGTLVLGERITSPVVPLADLAAHPGAYGSRSIATSGKVTAVCQEMGCWMELADASGKAHVRMHGHDFFVPKTASGHLARVQATVVAGAKGSDDECEDEKEGAKQAKVQLDATGVELD